ncbi:MAG: GspE/PulE family protein [Minisyncoccia bacterium]
MIQLPNSQLKQILLKANIIDGSTFDALAEEAKRKQQNIVDLLISEGLINTDYFLNLISQELGVKRVKLSAEIIDEKALHLITEEIARKFKAIPFKIEPDGSLDVAMENPLNLEIVDFLNLKLGLKINPFLAGDDDLNRGFILYESKQTKDFKTLIEESIQNSLKTHAKTIEEAAAALPMVAMIDNLMSYAVASRASDVHIEILQDVLLVRFRIDGILREIVRMPKEIHPALVARIKILSNLRVDEHSKPQDGRFRQQVGDSMIDVRVSVIPTFYGEKIEMRVLPASQKPLSFEQLGMLDDTIKLVEKAISKTYGMVLVCGPTGSGKTTTLYSIMNLLNRPEVNIISIEDPIEYEMRYVNQIQVNPAAGITFASGLRSILRQDPNIIMVGEIRDAETANIAVQAALTGHLVLSSLHTNDALTAIPRLIDMGIPPFLVSAVLNSVIAQRLARRIHLGCIESYEPSEEIYTAISNELSKNNINAKTVKLPKLMYRGRGCELDNFTGYYDRIGIYEILDITEEVRKLIIDPNFDIDKLRQIVQQQGMISMFLDGLRKVEKGLTTIEEVFRVIRE